MYCVLCKTDHEHHYWRHAPWIPGEPDGWACGKWFTPSLKSYGKLGREADLEQLHSMEKTATNESERTAIKHSIAKIQHESKRTKSMRDSLIKATREHNHDEIKDIHEIVGNKKVYQN